MKAKRLLIVLTALCFVLAFSHVLDFFINHIPVAQEGECLRMRDYPFGHTFKIIKNDSIKGESIVLVENDYNQMFTYEEMRYLQLTKVACQ